jgi:hypothetical protein
VVGAPLADRRRRGDRDGSTVDYARLTTVTLEGSLAGGGDGLPDAREVPRQEGTPVRSICGAADRVHLVERVPHSVELVHRADVDAIAILEPVEEAVELGQLATKFLHNGVRLRIARH